MKSIQTGGSNRVDYRVLIPLGVLLGICIFCNAAVVSMMQEISPNDWQAQFVYFSFGVILAQPAILGAWRVFGHGSLWLRTASVLVLGFLLIGVWVIGYVFGDGFFSPNGNELSLSLCAFLILVAVEVPLWGLKAIFGWRIAQESTDTSARVSILDVFINTGFVAIAFTLARQTAMAHADIPDFWRNLLITLSIVSGASLAVNSPLIWLVMKLNWWQRILGVVLSTLIGFGIVVAVAFLVDLNNPPPPHAIWGMFVMCAGGILTISTAFLLFRLAGFQLYWGRLSPASIESAKNPTDSANRLDKPETATEPETAQSDWS